MSDAPDLLAAKAALRREADAAARLSAAALGREAAECAARHFLAGVSVPPGAVVGAFTAMPMELDPAPLLAMLRARGHPIAMAVVERRGAPLGFRLWAPGDPLARGPLGVMQPGPDAPAATPELLVTPLAAFDREGYRLGRGGGYYDRTIEALRAAGPLLVVGFAFSSQMVARVPREAHDQRLDWIVTEEAAAPFA